MLFAGSLSTLSTAVVSQDQQGNAQASAGAPSVASRIEALEKSQGLGLFIRSLVGLDREAAMQAFSEFLKGSTATPDQIEFIELVVQELTLNGVMEADRLFQSPFTDINSQGPLGIFPPARVSSLVEVLADIRRRAVA